MKSEKSNYLGNNKISKLLLKFSLPCILSLVVSALYNIVDQIFIGNSELGYLGNAATGVVFPILIISLAFAWCFGDGTAAYLSICQGKNDTQNAHKCIGTGILVTILTGVVLQIGCLIFQEPILKLFGASDKTINMATDYFTILLWVLPIYMLMNMMNAVIRADGSPKFSMISMLAGAIINIILDPIFIFGFKWGIKGAAYATIIGQIVSFIICFIYFTRTKTFKLTIKSFIPNFKVFSHAIILGISTFITQMSIVVISLVCNIMLAKYGALSKYGHDIPIAVISIETKVFTIVINIVVGIILGGQPILGYNYGAKKYGRVKETYRLVFITTLIVGLVSTLIFEICPGLVIGIFGETSDPLYNEFAKLTFRIFLSLVTFTCLIKMTSIFFQAVGQPVKAAISSLIRDIVCFVPAVIILPSFFGITGILFAAPLADFISMIVAGILSVSFFKGLKESSCDNESLETYVIKPSKPGVIVTIARTHGSAGKLIGQLLAEKMGVACYYKETTALAAQETGLDKEFISNINENSPAIIHELYLSTNVVQQAVIAQAKVIRKIADSGSCVFVGRAADYILSESSNIIKVFIYAPNDYCIKKVMEMYGDSQDDAPLHIKKSNESRAAYYKNISGLEWGSYKNYDLCIDSSIGPLKTAQLIYEFVKLH